jgi:hypothetical protein
MEITLKRNPAAEPLATEITEARAALLEQTQGDPDRWWYAYELKDEARNGWSAGAMTMALSRLIDNGVFELKGDLLRPLH